MAYSNITGYPSPSDVLRPFIDSEWFTEESRERGIKVHAACCNHLLGKYVVCPRQYRGYFDSFKRWCDEEKPIPSIVEERLISEQYGFCGQPDMVGKIKSKGGIGVPDWKTGIAAAKDWPLRIAAYRWLAELKTGATNWGCSIRLKSDGTYPLVKYYSNYETDFNMFLSALNLWRHFNQ